MSCKICQTPSSELEGLETCPTCGRNLSDRGQAPGSPDQTAEPEPTGKRRKKPKEVVNFTEDSPIWESRMGSEFFLLRALRTCWQILRHPQRTFAAPRHSGNSNALGFLVTCWGTRKILQILIATVESLINGESIPARDFLLSTVAWPLDALISLGVVGLVLHLAVILFHRAHKGFDVTLQSAAYSMGFATLFLLLATFNLFILFLGVAAAHIPFAKFFFIFVDILPSLVGIYLLFFSLKTGHEMSSGKTAMVLVLPTALLASLYIFVWMN